MTGSIDTVVFDVDGTLVDTNYQHALAWYRALRGKDITVPLWQLHRHIGMGGDQFVGAVAGDDVEKRYGDELRDAWKEEYTPMIEEVQPFPYAREVLKEVKDRGLRLVLASSGAEDQVDHYLDLLAARDIADAWTTSADVEKTKPAPDLVKVAVGKVDGANAVMIGDSTWDFVAAGKLDVPSYALRTGGFSAEELREAGAREVYESLEELAGSLDTVLGAAGS